MIIFIGKTGSHPTGLFRYLLEEDRSVDPVLLESNFMGSTATAMGKEFHQHAQTRPDIKNPVWHGIISWAPGETIADDTMSEVSMEVMKGLGIDPENHHHALIRHDDTDHPHCHIVVNRVGFDGSIFLNQRSAEKAMEIREDIEAEYGFQPARTLDPKDPDLDLDIRETKAAERGVKIHKDVVHQEIKAAIAQSDGTFSDMDSILRDRQIIAPEWNFSQTTDTFHGGRFHVVDPHNKDAVLCRDGTDEPIVFKGSQVGWSAKNIQEALTDRLLEVHGWDPQNIHDQELPAVAIDQGPARSVDPGWSHSDRIRETSQTKPKLPPRLLDFSKAGRLKVPWAKPPRLGGQIQRLDQMLRQAARANAVSRREQFRQRQAAARKGPRRGR